jgi:DNA repair exonuclease SbcCD ATPase subunit
MKKLILSKLHIRDFKKINDLEIDFSQETTIAGTNGVGKSTIFDAYTWLLYGKNSHDQQDFSIKRLDSDGKVIHNLVASVRGVFILDSDVIELERRYKEKWTKKRGNEHEELTGHTTEYFIDQIPKSKSEFDTYVKDMISDTIAKVISSPLYFNEKMKWQERREILTSIAGDTTPEDVLNFAPAEFKSANELLALLEARKSLTDEKTRIASERKRLKEQLEGIAPKIEELTSMTVTELDATELDTKKADLNTAKEQINKQLEDIAEQNKAEQQKVIDSNNQLYKWQDEYIKAKRDLLKDHNDRAQAYEKRKAELRLEIQKIEFALSENGSAENQNEANLRVLTNLQAKLKEKYEAEKAKQFAAITENCPCCQRPMESNEQEQLEKFNLAKANAIKQIVAEAQDVKVKILECSGAIEVLGQKKDKLTIERAAKETYLKEVEASFVVEQEPADTSEMLALKNAIDTHKPYTPEAVCNNALKQEREQLDEQIKEVEASLAKLSHIAVINTRIAELAENKRALAQQIASLERVAFQIDAYEKAHIELVESRVNAKFAIVKWKMFDEQINGGLAPTCEATVNGTPYNDLNTAMKINAGLDVINALNYHFGMFAPVFIDARESIVEIIETDCQVISLQVDKAFDELTVIV